MLTPEELDGHQLALLLVSRTDDGEDEWNVVTGTVRRDGERVYLEVSPDQPFLELRAEWLGRINIVDETAREAMGARYYLSLLVSPMTDDPDLDDSVPAGLKWPD